MEYFFKIFLYMRFCCELCFPEETNITLNGEARQSSIFKPEDYVHHPEGGVDGSTNQDLFNGGTCPHTIDGEATHWWAINFHQIYMIDHIRLFNRKDHNLEYRLGNYYILLYDSPSATWLDYEDKPGSLCYHHPDTSPPILTFGCRFNMAKILKLSQNEPLRAGQPLTFCEIEIYTHRDQGYDGILRAKRKFCRITHRRPIQVIMETEPTKSQIMCAHLCRQTTGCIGFIHTISHQCVLVQSATDLDFDNSITYYEQC